MLYTSGAIVFAVAVACYVLAGVILLSNRRHLGRWLA